MTHVNAPLIVDGHTGLRLLGRAILNSSFKAAAVLASGCPELWNTEGPWSGFDTPCLLSLNTTMFRTINRYLDKGTVVDLVLHAGSYEQCQFLLEQLFPFRTVSATSASSILALSSRFTCGLETSRIWLGRLKKKPRREYGANDSGIPPWYDCPLKRSEYLALLSGNLLRSRANRQAIWDIIEAQANSGHPRSITHLRDAISYGNVEAVREMLNRGWPVESRRPLFSLTAWSPLLHIDFLREHKTFASDGLIEAMEEDSPPRIQISDAGTHEEIYKQYHEYHSNAVQEFYRERLHEVRQLLVDHGAKKPTVYLKFSFLSLAANDTLTAWAWIWFVLTYAIALPLALVYSTTHTWTSMTRAQKFVFSYLWSGLAASIGGFPMIFIKHGSGAKMVFYFTACAISFIGNHFALPYCIVRLNWSPLFVCKPATIVNGELVQSCTNYSFLMPLALFGLELVSFLPILRVEFRY